MAGHNEKTGNYPNKTAQMAPSHNEGRHMSGKDASSRGAKHSSGERGQTSAGAGSRSESRGSPGSNDFKSREHR